MVKKIPGNVKEMWGEVTAIREVRLGGLGNKPLSGAIWGSASKTPPVRRRKKTKNGSGIRPTDKSEESKPSEK